MLIIVLYLKPEDIVMELMEVHEQQQKAVLVPRGQQQTLLVNEYDHRIDELIDSDNNINMDQDDEDELDDEDDQEEDEDIDDEDQLQVERKMANNYKIQLQRQSAGPSNGGGNETPSSFLAMVQ